MGKISKSDQPARIDDDGAARLAEIDIRLHDMRRGHHAEGSGYSITTPFGKFHARLHWLEDGTYTLLGDPVYEKKIASLSQR